MTQLLDDLEADWARIADDPNQLDRLGTVGQRVDVKTLRELQNWSWTGEPAAINDLLYGLVIRGRDGDAFAARVLLHLLWPGVLSLTAKWQALGDADERASAAVNAVYGRIRRYPVESRPRAVAANILLDAAKDLRYQARQACDEPTGLQPVGVEVAAHEPVSSAAEDLLRLLVDAVDAGVITVQDARLVGESRIADRELTAIAPGPHVRTLQRRRRAAEVRLIAAVAAA